MCLYGVVCQVEEAQREKAKYRKERGIEWVPKVSVKVKQNSFTFANNVGCFPSALQAT